MRFNKAKCKVLCWVGAIPAFRLGDGMNGLRTALQRRTWGWWMKGWKKLAIGTHSPQSQLSPGLPPKQCGQQGKGEHSASLLWLAPLWSAGLSSGVSSRGRTWTAWSKSRGGCQADQKDEEPLLQGKEKRLRGLGLFGQEK